VKPQTGIKAMNEAQANRIIELLEAINDSVSSLQIYSATDRNLETSNELLKNISDHVESCDDHLGKLETMIGELPSGKY
jgi:hypothetical protein